MSLKSGGEWRETVRSVNIDHLELLTLYVETFRPCGTRKPRGPLRASPLRPSRCQGGAASASPPLAKPRHHQRHPPRFWQGSSLLTKKYCFRVNCSGTRVAMAHKQWAAIGVLQGNCLAPPRGARHPLRLCPSVLWTTILACADPPLRCNSTEGGSECGRTSPPLDFAFLAAGVRIAGRGNAAGPPLRTADSVGASLLDRCTWH